MVTDSHEDPVPERRYLDHVTRPAAGAVTDLPPDGGLTAAGPACSVAP